MLQIRVKCNEDDTIGDLKKMVAAQTGKHAGKACPMLTFLSTSLCELLLFGWQPAPFSLPLQELGQKRSAFRSGTQVGWRVGKLAGKAGFCLFYVGTAMVPASPLPCCLSPSSVRLCMLGIPMEPACALLCWLAPAVHACGPPPPPYCTERSSPICLSFCSVQGSHYAQ